MSPSSDVRKILLEAKRAGLLLKQDKVLPSVVTLVTGERVAGSWWSHPLAQGIFAVIEALEEHRDVLFVKLIARKDTLVHRRLWPALLAVGSAREDWQLCGLGASAKRLLVRLDGEGEVRAAGEAGKVLALRLLCFSRQEHTPSGRHETVLESWTSLAKRLGVARDVRAEEGKATLEAAALRLGAARRMLPWGKP